MPPWWTDADDADARSHQTPETTHLTLQPPEPDAPPEAWEPFNAECDELERIIGEHYDANVHRWRCRTCAFWESAYGRVGRCGNINLEWIDETAAEENRDCIEFYPRNGAGA